VTKNKKNVKNVFYIYGTEIYKSRSKVDITDQWNLASEAKIDSMPNFIPCGVSLARFYEHFSFRGGSFTKIQLVSCREIRSIDSRGPIYKVSYDLSVYRTIDLR